MSDVHDVDPLRFPVDPIQQPVRAAAGAEQAGEVAFEGLADVARLAGQVTEGELDDRRDDAWRDALQRARRAGPVNWTS